MRKKEKFFNEMACNCISEGWKDTVELFLITSMLLVIRFVLTGTIPSYNWDVLSTSPMFMLLYFIVCTLFRYSKKPNFDIYIVRGGLFLYIMLLAFFK